MRPLLRGEPVTYEGKFVTLTDAQIHDLLAAESSIVTGEIPLYLGVTGRRAVEPAGELADGVLMNVCLPVEYVQRAAGWLADGAARGGRAAGEIDVAIAILTSPDHDSDECQERLDEYRAAGVAASVLVALEGSIPLEIDSLR